MSETLCAIKRSWDDTAGGHDLYDSPVARRYWAAAGDLDSEADPSYWDLCWLRDEDIHEDWPTAYVGLVTGKITTIDPGDGLVVRLKATKYGVDNLADTEPDGRTTGGGAPITRVR